MIELWLSINENYLCELRLKKRIWKHSSQLWKKNSGLYSWWSIVFITARITSIFVSSTAVHMYDFHVFPVVYSPLWGFIWNQHNDQLPVSLLAQLIEHCTGIAEIMGSNPVQAWIFFRHYFHFYLSRVHNCEDRFACVAFIWGQEGTGLLQSTSPWRWLLVYLAAGSKICSFLLPIERHHGHRIWDISAQGARLDRWLQYRSSKCW